MAMEIIDTHPHIIAKDVHRYPPGPIRGHSRTGRATGR